MRQNPRPWTVSFDHVAIAVNDPAQLKRVLVLIGLVDEGSEPVPSQGVLTHFLKPETSDARVEILEKTDPQGTVAKYLAKRGPGIHHISFRVAGLEEISQTLRENGVRLVYDAPRPGAHHTRVNFIHPDSAGGVLIELSEKSS